MIQEGDTITGKQIADFRKKTGLSQQDLSQMIGVSLPTVKRWESGESTPRDRHLVALTAILGGAGAAALGTLGAGLALGPVGALLVGLAALAGLVPGRTAAKGPRGQQETVAQAQVSQQLWRVLEEVSLHFPIPRNREERERVDKVRLELDIDRVLAERFQEEANLRGFTQSRLLESLLWLFLEMPQLSFQKNDALAGIPSPEAPCSQEDDTAGGKASAPGKPEIVPGTLKYDEK